MNTPLDLDALKTENAARRARKDAATPGPWTYSFRGYSITVSVAGGEHIATLHDSEPSLLHKFREADALFIAATRDDPVEDRIDSLIAEIERLRVALYPFAVYARYVDEETSLQAEPTDPIDIINYPDTSPTFEDCRKAAEVLDY